MSDKFIEFLDFGINILKTIKTNSKNKNSSKKKNKASMTSDVPNFKRFDIKRFKEIDAFIEANSTGDVIVAAEKLLSKEDADLYKKGLKYQAGTGKRL